MFRKLLVTLLLSASLLAPVTRSFAADTDATSPFTDKQRDALDAAIKAYILDNPQVLISSVEAYYKTQTDKKQEQEGNLTQFPAGLLDYKGAPETGNKDAKVAVIEFFDYNCGYCKQVASDFKRLIGDETNVRYIFKELPILSDTSEVAARYALAANMQGKYLAYHDSLMSHQGSISEDYLLATAKDVGLNFDKLKVDAGSQDVRDQLAKNVDLARELGVRGTPFFIIGKQKIPGAVGYSKMKETIAQERGDAPAATPAAAATPTAPAATSDETTVTPAAPATATAPSVPAATSDDADVQSEMNKARSEANAMIEELKAQAAQIQKQAADMQKQAAEQAAKTKPAASKATPAAKK